LSQAAVVVEGRGASVPLAAIDATLPDVDELVASYGFVTPAVRLFRRRIMFDFAVEADDSVRRDIGHPDPLCQTCIKCGDSQALGTNARFIHLDT
jgi:hypothetical protein